MHRCSLSWVSCATAFWVVVSSCTDQGTGPIAPPIIPCEDASVLALPRFSVTTHKRPKQIKGSVVELPETQWARGDSVKAFFGGKDFKLVFTLNRAMYLVAYHDGEPTVSRISQDDEGIGGALGSINSPLFSPDGNHIVFAGTTRGKPAFVQELGAPDEMVWRVPLDPQAHVTADPHWHIDDGRTWIYFATIPGLVSYSDRCEQIAGSTYRVELTGDTTISPIEVSGIPGAYRAGLSLDGEYVGTSYASSAIYDRMADSTHLLAGGDQQCNASMNAFPVGSKHNDYMMILAFGETQYQLITGDSVTEGLHENLWIYNKDAKIVWQGKRPNEDYYLRFDKPEWSTHANYATAVALRRVGENGDLMVVKIGDIANADEGELNQAEAYLTLATGGMNSDSYSHLWVEP